jgi:ribosomal protein S18 acetylase RimI-like enzyme
MVTLIRPRSAKAWNAAGRLVDEYAASLNVALDFQGFEHERTHLAEEYGCAGAVFLLAKKDGEFVGCGAIRRFSETACEMKRLYVAPRGQRAGVGRMLATALIAEARQLGYRTMLLDTLPSMHTAQALYASLGFTPIPPYRFNPIEGTTFLALDL